MLKLPRYIEIKDNYCISYFGHSQEYLLQLKYVRPFIEKEFPELKLFIACSDIYYHLIKDDPKSLNKTNFLIQKENFSYIREICSNGSVHPIEELIEESCIPINPINIEANLKNNICSILPFGTHPVKSLKQDQIIKIKENVEKIGFKVSINENFENASWIVGVESAELFKQILIGKKITLINTGLGSNFHKKLFPNIDILNI